MAVTPAQLRALDAVVRAGSFSQAAAWLGVAQPSVSGAVAALEREVGGSVVDRRTAEPTRLGAALLPHARAVVAALEAVADVAREHAAGPTGTVTVAVVPTVRAGVLPRLLEVWSQALPGVRVLVLEGDDREMLPWLDGGIADVALLVDPEPALVADPRCVALPSDAIMAVLRRDHPLALEAEVTLPDLLDDEMLWGTGGCEDQMRAMHARAGIPVGTPFRFSGLGTILGLVGRGRGITLMPGHGRAMLPDGLVAVPVAPEHRRSLWLAGPSCRAWTPLAELLLAATPAAGVPGEVTHTAVPDGETDKSSRSWR